MTTWKITIWQDERSSDDKSEVYLVHTDLASTAIGNALRLKFGREDLPDVIDIRVEQAPEGLLVRT